MLQNSMPKTLDKLSKLKMKPFNFTNWKKKTLALDSAKSRDLFDGNKQFILSQIRTRYENACYKRTAYEHPSTARKQRS